MRYLTACSGIEAPTAAWHRLGWQPLAFSEIEAFPRAVLKFRYPTVPLHGDLTAVDWSEYRGRADLFAAGTPCQSFSIAGLRKGLADPRGNLTLAFLGAVDAARPRWLVWENVPGILSHDQGRSFGTFLGALGKLGYGFAYRVLDAQYFGVPQRRRRVFVVGYLGDWRPAAAVLFEREGLCGHPAPRRQARARVTGSLGGVSPGGGWRCGADEAAAGQLVAGEAVDLTNTRCGGEIVGTLGTEQAHGNKGQFIAHPIPFDTTQITSPENRSNPAPGDPASTLAKHGHAPAIAFSSKDHGADAGELAPTLRAMGHSASHANGGGQLAVAIPLLEPGRRVGASESQHKAGDGFGTDGDPMFTLNADRPHGVAFQCHGSNVGEMGTVRAGNGNASGGVPFTIHALQDPIHTEDVSLPLGAKDTGHALAFQHKASHHQSMNPGAISPTLDVGKSDGVAVYAPRSGVRRLTPMECERLQGMPDGYTLIPVKQVKRTRLNSPKVNGDGIARYAEIDGEVWQLAADGPRYKAIGNSMAVPVLSWLGERIELVEALLADLAHAT